MVQALLIKNPNINLTEVFMESFTDQEQDVIA
jgi:hypothetical protein